MNKQVMSLKQRGIKAEYLGSAQTDPTVQRKAETGHFHLLFMTPEKACSIPIRSPFCIFFFQIESFNQLEKKYFHGGSR